jgi:hypothetical protein
MELGKKQRDLVCERLNEFNRAVNKIYVEYQHRAIPMALEPRQELIKECAPELQLLFETIFRAPETAKSALNKFYHVGGNLFDFFCTIDDNQMEELLAEELVY